MEVIEDNKFNDINIVRQKRALTVAAGCYIESQNHRNQDEKIIDWNRLHTLPHWCYWPEVERHRLLLLCGAMFLAPTIRLWINANQVREVRRLLGDVMFERIMDDDCIPRDPVRFILIHTDDISDMLLTAGATVLIGSTESVFHTYCMPLLPQPVGKLSPTLAQCLLRYVFHLMNDKSFIKNKKIDDDNNQEGRVEHNQHIVSKLEKDGLDHNSMINTEFTKNNVAMEVNQ